MPEKYEPKSEAIHEWFELTYASYLVLPRSILQSLPDNLQRNLVACLNEIDSICLEHGIATPSYKVIAIDENNKFMKDPYRDYERGRRDVLKENKNV